MKKLYAKGKVHPSPPPVDDPLSLLPAAILTLTAALSPEDLQVLSYLISCYTTSSNFSCRREGSEGVSCIHPPMFDCGCFGCYMSYWVRWDNSPNRHLIHEIIEAYEDGLHKRKKGKGKKDRRKRGRADVFVDHAGEKLGSGKSSESVELMSPGGGDGGVRKTDDGDQSEQSENGSVRRIVNFVAEKIWRVWGI